MEEAKALVVDKKRLERIERLRELKTVYDDAALSYNETQTKAAEANRIIDEYKSQINEVEQQIKTVEDELHSLSNRLAFTRDESKKQSLLGERKVLEKNVKKYNRRLKGHRRQLAKAVETARETDQQLEKAYAAFQKAEAKFSPYAGVLEEEEKKVAEEQATIAKAINEAREREQRKKLELKLTERKKRMAVRRVREREKATKKLERELALMKKERVKKAVKEGRELTPAELDQWSAKEQKLRERLSRQYSEFDLDGTGVDELDPKLYPAAKSELKEAEEDFYRIQNDALQSEKELVKLRATLEDLEKEEQEIGAKYNERIQAALNAKGTEQEEGALIEAQEIEELYIEATTSLMKYRRLETEAVKKALNSKRKLVEAKDRLDLARQRYEGYQRRIEKSKKEQLEEAEYIRGIVKETRPAGTAGPEGISYQGPWPLDRIEQDISIRADQPAGNTYDIIAVVITGDKDVVVSLKNWRDYERDALNAPMSDADIEAFRQRLLKDLQDEGYVFAAVSVYSQSLRSGVLKFRIYVGKKGEATVVGNRWYTARQILNSTSWKTGEQFNYRRLYSNLFNLNTKPDIRVNTKLIPKIGEHGQRTIDVEMNVIDKLPIHGAIRLSNTGVDETSDWRLRSTVQHLNVTHRYDTLTADWLTDPVEIRNVNAISSSYYLPINDANSLTLYGGWSESTITDIFPEIDIFGEGKYFGAQYSRMIKSTDKFDLDTTFGWLFQNVENSNEFSGEREVIDDINLSMPSLAISYSEKDFDGFGGRNFVSNTVQVNFSGKLGSSNTSEFKGSTPNADGNFIINRFQFARFQRLFSEKNRPGKWTLFLRFDGQITDEALIPAVQSGFGGANTVRGYEEREVSADRGFTGTVELQTPLMSNFIPALQRSQEYLSNNPGDWTVHRLQFTGFYDFGRAEKIETIEGEDDNESFSSLGAGFRFALTKYAQLSFDYGFPLISTEESSGGRGHLSLQVQF